MSIVISSQGGDLDAAMAMHELIRLRVGAGGIVQTIGIGSVMSAAVLLLCCGSKGHRVLSEFTNLLYHESSTEIRGTTSRIRTELDALAETDGNFDQLVATYCGKRLDQVQKLYAKGDNWMSAKQAHRFGFVDKVV